MFQIGPLSVGRLNAAGLFMAVLWLIYVIVSLTLFEDVSNEWNNWSDRVNI